MPRTVHIGENDLRSWCLKNNAEYILDEWDMEKNDGLIPEKIACFSSKSRWWKCLLGHSYPMAVGKRTIDKSRCPYCTNHRVLAGFNDFQTWCKKNEKIDLLEEWNYSKNNDMKPYDIMHLEVERRCGGYVVNVILNGNVRFIDELE